MKIKPRKNTIYKTTVRCTLTPQGKELFNKDNFQQFLSENTLEELYKRLEFTIFDFTNNPDLFESFSIDTIEYEMSLKKIFPSKFGTDPITIKSLIRNNKLSTILTD